MAIPNKYDAIFEKYRGTIPLAFLRTLAFSQSNLNTNKSVSNSAGLFMISEPALQAFDKKFPSFMPPSPHKFIDLSDPALNTVIAVWIIDNITTYYANKYPNSMSKNWNSPVYAAIIAHSFNVGYAEPKGLGAAIKKFELMPDKLSLDSLAQVAKELKLGERKYSEKDINRARTVGNLYIADLGGKAPVSAPTAPGETEVKAKGGLGFLMALPVIGLGLYAVTKKK